MYLTHWLTSIHSSWSYCRLLLFLVLLLRYWWWCRRLRRRHHHQLLERYPFRLMGMVFSMSVNRLLVTLIANSATHCCSIWNEDAKEIQDKNCVSFHVRQGFAGIRGWYWSTQYTCLCKLRRFLDSQSKWTTINQLFSRSRNGNVSLNRVKTKTTQKERQKGRDGERKLLSAAVTAVDVIYVWQIGIETQTHLKKQKKTTTTTTTLNELWRRA